MKPLSHQPSFTTALPQDAEEKNFIRQVQGAAYSLAQPLKFPNSAIIHVSDLAYELGFKEEDINDSTFEAVFTGQELVKGSTPYAMGYAGHQFGHWAGQLGDGRAINLFESIINGQRWAFQLKGAGPTPYSRRGDGLAVLRSSIREHLCSEAMHHLGIPTTRSLSLALSGEQVLRDVMYDGNAAYEPGAIVCRVAPSFIRFGHFEWFAAQGDHELLKKLTDYTISTFYPDITGSGKEAYLEFFQEVTDRTLKMIMHWQRVGFVHGVMNTDNMSILGLTIDYGPFGFLDPYDHSWTPNTTDNQHKRYRYGAQPEIGLWNLLQLANALFPLIEDSKALQGILNSYKTRYQQQYLSGMAEKLGWQKANASDIELIQRLENLLHEHETDMTLFYRELSKVEIDHSPEDAFKVISMSFYELAQMTKKIKNQWLSWLEDYGKRTKHDNDKSSLTSVAFAKARTQQMNATNPKYILRNYIAQMVIDAAEQGDYSVLREVYDMLKRPYEEQPQYDQWYAKRPDWAKDKVGCSRLSCSS
ncbi:protein adenylyltransferase SelO [Nonlabens xiamenensis]|uniref:protein adenylyltransferase SelO n=1 Tax=Nonlabens xiamenensis TaxID=2341043 RepID=UPI000F60FD90|nr:YdiU family protein [Nonlabens xiamenensis]